MAVALTGALCLAALMGIGRFAFTPVLPMMLTDGSLSLGEASGLASLNYLGYLLGALACAMGLMRGLQHWVERLPRGPRMPSAEVTILGAMLGATAVLTAAMAMPWAAGWPVWRFASGMVSAIGFVATTQWCLTQLAQRERMAWGGLMYTGPGLGIAGSGLAAGGMVALGWPAGAAWAVFGALALVLSALAWRTLRQDCGTATPTGAVVRGGPDVRRSQRTGPEDRTNAAAHSQAQTPKAPSRSPTPAPAEGDSATMWMLTGAYGLAGLGYVIPATFMPVMARAWLGAGAPDTWSPLLVDLFWPLFGVGIVVGALVATRVRESTNLRGALAVCYLIQAIGVALGAWMPSATGLAGGSLLLGLPFTAITFFAMQEVRRLRPLTATRWIGLTTAAYGIGQIAGPPLAAGLVALSGDAAAGFRVSMHLAAGALLLGAALFVGLMRR
jgi:MFS family permease